MSPHSFWPALHFFLATAPEISGLGIPPGSLHLPARSLPVHPHPPQQGHPPTAARPLEAGHPAHPRQPAQTVALRREDAYRRYGLYAAQGITNLNVFRATASQYPEKDKRQVLLDLIEARGNKGKWFAAAKDAGFLDIALECARTGETEPKTLLRAARDFQEQDAEFALQIALYAAKSLLGGRGYEPSTADIREACDHLIAAATRLERLPWAKTELEHLLSDPEMCTVPEMKKELQARLHHHLASQPPRPGI